MEPYGCIIIINLVYLRTSATIGKPIEHRRSDGEIPPESSTLTCIVPPKTQNLTPQERGSIILFDVNNIFGWNERKSVAGFQSILVTYSITFKGKFYTFYNRVYSTGN